MMSDIQQGDWTKPAAMAIPKGGVFEDKVQQGRYGPIFPKSPACYGFTIIAKIIPGREDVFYGAVAERWQTRKSWERSGRICPVAPCLRRPPLSGSP